MLQLNDINYIVLKSIYSVSHKPELTVLHITRCLASNLTAIWISNVCDTQLLQLVQFELDGDFGLIYTSALLWCSQHNFWQCCGLVQ